MVDFSKGLGEHTDTPCPKTMFYLKYKDKKTVDLIQIAGLKKYIDFFLIRIRSEKDSLVCYIIHCEILGSYLQ